MGIVLRSWGVLVWLRVLRLGLSLGGPAPLSAQEAVSTPTSSGNCVLNLRDTDNTVLAGQVSAIDDHTLSSIRGSAATSR